MQRLRNGPIGVAWDETQNRGLFTVVLDAQHRGVASNKAIRAAAPR
jgi:hypothetical protein